MDETTTTERMLAFVRAVLALATLAVAVKLYYEVQFEYRPMALMLELLLIYSFLMSFVTRHKPEAIRKMAIASSLLEVGLVTALIASTGGSDSPFYLWYVFYVVSVALRYGMQYSILALSASVVLYTYVTSSAVSLSLAPKSYIPAFLGSTGLLFILALLFGLMSEKQKNYRVQLAVVNDMGIALSSISSSTEIENQLVAQAADLMQVDKCWFASLPDHGPEGVRYWVGPDTSPAGIDLGEWSPERIIAYGRARMTNEKRRQRSIPSDAALKLGIRKLAGVPLMVHDTPVGVLYAVNRRVGAFTATDTHLLDLIASQAAPLLENARLAERLRDAAAAEERLRIARDLHDNFLQTLAAIKLHLERCSILMDKDPDKAKAAIGRIQEIAAGGLSEVRSYLSQLRLAGPDPEQLKEAIKQFAEASASSVGYHLDLTLNIDPKRLNQDIGSAAFQVIRELVNNAAKHSNPSNVEVSAVVTNSTLTLGVKDDGDGFDVEEVRRSAAARGHLGLVGIEERIKPLGGSLVIESVPGKGTVAKVRLPLQASA
jgi:signal transduction histidine kinase